MAFNTRFVKDILFTMRIPEQALEFYLNEEDALEEQNDFGAYRQEAEKLFDYLDGLDAFNIQELFNHIEIEIKTNPQRPLFELFFYVYKSVLQKSIRNYEKDSTHAET